MSRKGQRESARAARLEAVQREQRHRARKRAGLIVAGLAAVALVGGGSWAVIGNSGSEPSVQGKVALTGLQTYPGLARDHVAGAVVYPQTPPVVASAWGVQLKLSSASDPRLRSFVETYKSGSHAPEPGGECTGGTGTLRACR